MQLSETRKVRETVMFCSFGAHPSQSHAKQVAEARLHPRSAQLFFERVWHYLSCSCAHSCGKAGDRSGLALRH